MAEFESIFSLQRLDWSKQAAGQDGNRELRKMAIGNNVLVVATANCTLLRRNLDSNGLEEEIDISRGKQDSIEHVFIDPTGNHVIVTLTNGDNFYLHSRSTRPKKFSSKLQGNIESVAFDRLNGTESTTRSFLAGTSTGCIYELGFDSGGKEKTCTLLHQLDPEQPLAITSLHFDTIRGASPQSASRTFVMLATTKPTRLYHFFGGASFSQVFAKSTAGSAAYSEMPGDIPRAELLCFNYNSWNRAQNFALMSMEGIYQGSINLSDDKTSEEGTITLDAELMPYGDYNDHEPPQAIAASAFHYVTLVYDRLVCISRLNGTLVQEEMIRIADGNAIGIVKDVTKGTIWLYTDSYVFKISVLNEDKHIWSIYLEKALAGEDSLFEVAYRHCKKQDEKARVMNARAEFALKSGNVEQAAAYFARSGAAFENVVLRLLSTGSTAAGSSSKHSPKAFSVTVGPELSALRIYLMEEIELLPAGSKSQHTMICTWLCEIFLHEITMAVLTRDGNVAPGSPARSGSNAEILIAQFKVFLKTASLDPATTINLICSRGAGVHRELLLAYVQIIGDYDRIVGHLIMERLYAEALQVLTDASFERVEELIYKFSPVLIQFEPEAAVRMFVSKRRIKVHKILPSLLRYATCLDAQLSGKQAESDEKMPRLDQDSSGAQANFAVRYLSEYVANVRDGRNVEIVAFHTMLWFLVKYDASDESELCAYLERLFEMKEDGFFAGLKINYEYILRQCKSFNRRRGIVYAYFLIGMDYEAVEAALKVDISLAKKVALNPRDANQKKKLWLIIALHVITTDSDAKRALLLIQESDGTLKIEDLLPLLPDFTEIELFKEDICGTLEECGQRIDHLKFEMEELSETAEGINTELDAMKKRGYSVSSLQHCEYCRSALFSRQFYLFPCSHGFHNDCMLKRVHTHKHLDDKQLEAVNVLNEQIRVISRRAKDDKRAMAQQEYLQNELDGYIAADCPLCGYVMIRSLSLPLISEDDAQDAASWDL